MAINVNFIGRLGADCEVKELNNGEKFVSFRIAVDDFKNGQYETVWFEVSDYSEKALKIAPFLKKGKLLSVHGIERLRLYQSKTGEYNIGRDVTSYRLDFVNVGSGNTITNNQTENTLQNKELNSTITQVQTFPNQQVVSFDNLNNASSNDDDLPF